MTDQETYAAINASGTASAPATPNPSVKPPEWTDLTDLASATFGGDVVFATDEWFAGCNCMINPSAPTFAAGEFSAYGKWMDGWESRRKRIPGNDWCIIKLGFPGRIIGVLVDTAHFTGNNVPRFTLRGTNVQEDDPAMAALTARRSPCFGGGQCQGADAETMAAAEAIGSDSWSSIIPKTPLKPGYEETRRHFFQIDESKMGCGGKGWTHVRLDMFPDGGIARLKIFGEVAHHDHDEGQVQDLLAASEGGVPVACSNKHYGTPANLIAPGRAAKMDEGWETARNPHRPSVHRLGADGKLKLPGSMTDWCIFRMATVGSIEKIEVDTNHFKGNCPESCLIEGVLLEEEETRGGEAHSHMASDETMAKFESLEYEIEWETVLPRTALTPHNQHYFTKEDLAAAAGDKPYSHIKLTIYPDGGISRLRVHGIPRHTGRCHWTPSGADEPAQV